MSWGYFFFFFFFQAEDGIRDADVTGVQTCALPISLRRSSNRTLSRGNGGTGLLHEDCFKARSNLHGSPWLEGSLQRLAWHFDLQAAAVFGLGRRGIDRGAAELCCQRRLVSPCTA